MLVNEIDGLETIELQELENASLTHQFVVENNLTGLKEIVTQKRIDIDRRNENNQTALHLACDYGNVRMVELLIDNGANVLARDNNDFTPFLLASYGGHLQCAEKIFQRHPSVDQVDKNGWSSLLWASYKGHFEIVKFLLKKNANLNLSVSYNMTSLLWAAGRGHFNIVELLCTRGAKVNHVDKFGNTALIWASRRGYSDIVECLLRFDSDPNIVGASGCSSLINAVKGAHEECVVALLQNPKTNLNQTDRGGHTALSLSAKQGSVEMTIKLLERGAYLNLTDQYGDTPLIKAVKYGHLDTVKVLLGKFADVDAKGKDGKTALHIGCETGNVAIIRQLLNCNCKVECLNGNKETPLLRAVKEGNILVTKALLNQGADVSAYDQNHDTCIHIAIRQQNLQLVELLLRNPKNGRFLYQENKSGETPYDIDMHSSKKILSQLFGSKGFSTAAISTDSTFDVSSCSLAEMLTEPMLEAPVCIGLYSKWGSDVSLLLNKIKDQMELFSGALPIVVRHLSWITLFLVAYVAATVAVLMCFLFPERILAGLLTFFLIFLIVYFLILLVHLGALYRKWPWAKAANLRFKRTENYMKLISQICFLRYRAPSSGGKVRFIFAGCMNLAPIKEKDMTASITATLLRSVENSVGKLAVRLARTLPTDSMYSDQKVVLRKVCCVPLFLILFGWIIGFSTIIILVIAAYGPARVQLGPVDLFRINVVLVVLAVLLGCVLALSLPVLIKVFVSLFHSPNRIQKTRGSELNRNKTEVNNVAQALAIIDAINKTKTRICLLINGLETSDPTQLALLIHSVRSIYAIHPIISIMCIDYNLVSTAVKQSSFCFFNSGDIKENDYIQHVIQVPIFLPDKKRRKRFIENQSHFDSDTDADTHSLQKRKKYPKYFDVTKWLTSDECFQPIDSLIIKRVASIISFTARLLRSGGKDFSWNNLSAWIVLTELWAYSTTCLISYIGKKSITQNRSLKSLYLEIKHLFANSQSGDVCDAYSLQRFITSKSCGLTVSDVVSFHQYTVNLDPALEDLIPTYSDAWGSVSAHSQPVASTAMSSTSNLSCDDVPLCDWTVEDVCFKIKSIPGLDIGNFQLYSNFVHKNNFHGLALSLCDLDELKKELKTSFGDWCLIKKFITEMKASVAKEKQISFSSLNSSEKKTSETAAPSEQALSEDVQHISTLARSDRIAYDKAFKEYLKLQPQSSAVVSHNDSHNALVHAQLDNESFPLLNNLDINAN